MSKKSKVLPKVEVRWADSVALSHGWRPPSHYINSASTTMRRMVTIGLLVHKDKESVLIAHSAMVGNGNVDHCMSIPRSQIVEIRRLR